MANALNDTRRISHGTPYDVRNRADVWQGMKDAYINAIQAAPEWLVGQMAPEQYNRGVIASTPKDRIRAAQMHREQNIAQRRQDIGRDYEQGMDYGTALGMIADPYLDLPLAGVAKLASVGKLGRAEAKPFNALSDLAGERGAIDIPSGKLSEFKNDLFGKQSKSTMIGDETKIADHGNIKEYEADYKTQQGRSVRYTMEDDNGETIGALQILADGKRGKTGTIANITVHPDVRRKGVATELINKASEKFKIKHSKDMTTQGKAWRESL